MDLQRLTGVLTASVTPVMDSGAIDKGAVGALMDYYGQSGLNGVLIPSSTGEYFALTNKQQQECMRAAAGQNPKNLTLIGNISAGSLKDIVKNAKTMADAGAEAVVLMPPQFHHHTQEELIAYYIYVAEHCDVPLIIYNHMTRLPSKIEIPTVMALKDHPNIVGIKDTHNDGARLMTLSTLIKAEDNFLILVGGDGMAGYSALYHMEMLNALSALRPDIFIDLYAAGRAGDLVRVSALQQRVNKLMTVFTALQGGKSSAALFSQALKVALWLKGLCSTKAVQLGYDISQGEIEKVKQIVEEA